MAGHSANFCETALDIFCQSPIFGGCSNPHHHGHPQYREVRESESENCSYDRSGRINSTLR